MSELGWIESLLRSPADDPTAWLVAPYRLGNRDFQIARPRDPDRLLDDPTVLAASRSGDYMPYWAYMWPGARILAEYVAGQQRVFPGGVLEIGCGLGLAGLAALAVGNRVTFSDYSPAALTAAAHNAGLNGFTQFETRMIDWQSPPPGDFALILGADCLYEARCVPQVLHVLDVMLRAGGESWLSDPGRSVADPFPAQASERGYSVRVISEEGGRIFLATKPAAG